MTMPTTDNDTELTVELVKQLYEIHIMPLDSSYIIIASGVDTHASTHTSIQTSQTKAIYAC